MKKKNAAWNFSNKEKNLTLLIHIDVFKDIMSK